MFSYAINTGSFEEISKLSITSDSTFLVVSFFFGNEVLIYTRAQNNMTFSLLQTIVLTVGFFPRTSWITHDHEYILLTDAIGLEIYLLAYKYNPLNNQFDPP